MNYKLIINELANLNPPITDFTNKTVIEALKILNNPQHKYQVIHIAGTNGKGSTAAFIEAGLLQASYRTGKFTSPYIHELNECIRFNGSDISDQELAECYLQVKHKLTSAQILLSSFEMLTVVMFFYFADIGIDYLVLETGLGGLDDSTNVVNSQYSIITNISLEHTQWLGNSLESIAKHKAGIIRSGKTIIADSTPELISAVCKNTNQFTNVLNKYKYQIKLNIDKFTTTIKFKPVNSDGRYKIVELSLFGYFQAYNFLLAYECLSDIGIDFMDIAKAAHNTIWHGRLQRISKYPLIIADASHNVAGCEKLYQSINQYFNKDKTVIICSILKDKNISNMLDYYSKIGSTIIFCPVKNSRSSNPFELAKKAAGKFKNIYVANSSICALEIAKRLRYQLTIISGSTYLLHEVI